MNEDKNNQNPEPVNENAPTNDTNSAEASFSESTTSTLSNKTQTAGTEPATTVVGATTRKRNLIIGAVIAVVILLLGLWYVMERNGQINTGILDAFEQARLEGEVVATVDGEEITAYDLAISQEQIAAAARAQGVDLSDPASQQSIRDQAIEMLVNTELLRQEAQRRGLSVTDEEVSARYDTLVNEVGGEAVLAERMGEFGVTEDILFRDIRNELTIQKLLDEVFTETEIAVSDEDIAEFYESAGGVEAGLPPLEEVRGQIEQQLMSSEEQGIITEFVESLREEATVDIKIEL